jgi:hypothetical protein
MTPIAWLALLFRPIDKFVAAPDTTPTFRALPPTSMVHA